MKYDTFCGGVFETNCYLFHAPEGAVLFDAPDGSCAWLQNRGVSLKLLILTHGHIDHVGGVPRMYAETGAPVAMHPDDLAILPLKRNLKAQIAELERDL